MRYARRLQRNASTTLFRASTMFTARQLLPKFFGYTGAVGRVGDNIELTNASRNSLLIYKNMIDYVAVSDWVRFTEQFTASPKLHDKIDGSNLRRGAVSVWRDSLMAIRNGKRSCSDSADIKVKVRGNSTDRSDRMFGQKRRTDGNISRRMRGAA